MGSSFLSTLLVRTALRIEAGIRNDEPLHRTAAGDVGLKDLVDVGCCHSAVPCGFGIYHYGRTMLALIETTGFVGADPAFQPACGKSCLEELMQLTLAAWIA